MCCNGNNAERNIHRMYCFVIRWALQICSCLVSGVGRWVLSYTYSGRSVCCATARDVSQWVLSYTDDGRSICRDTTHDVRSDEPRDIQLHRLETLVSSMCGTVDGMFLKLSREMEKKLDSHLHNQSIQIQSTQRSIETLEASLSSYEKVLTTTSHDLGTRISCLVQTLALHDKTLCSIISIIGANTLEEQIGTVLFSIQSTQLGLNKLSNMVDQTYTRLEQYSDQLHIMRLPMR